MTKKQSRKKATKNKKAIKRPLKRTAPKVKAKPVKKAKPAQRVKKAIKRPLKRTAPKAKAKPVKKAKPAQRVKKAIKRPLKRTAPKVKAKPIKKAKPAQRVKKAIKRPLKRTAPKVKARPVKKAKPAQRVKKARQKTRRTLKQAPQAIKLPGRKKSATVTVIEERVNSTTVFSEIRLLQDQYKKIKFFFIDLAGQPFETLDSEQAATFIGDQNSLLYDIVEEYENENGDLDSPYFLLMRTLKSKGKKLIYEIDYSENKICPVIEPDEWAVFKNKVLGG